MFILVIKNEYFSLYKLYFYIHFKNLYKKDFLFISSIVSSKFKVFITRNLSGDRFLLK